MKTKKVLLLGYGSIGKRHAKNLIELGIRPYILTKYPDNLNAPFFKDINEIKNVKIDYCIISSPTARHLDDFKKCLLIPNIPNKMLIEKPLECSYSKGEEIKNIAEESGLSTFVAYNLRFLKIFDVISKFVKEQKNMIRIVEVIAGQDLKEWRPFKDYTQSYSAYRAQGGGVDLDLSHEIDYTLWLFGNYFKDKIIYRNKISNLKIDSPDIFKLILDYNTFIVDITLDYIRKPKERYIKIICENGKNLYYNFITSTLKVDKKTIIMNDNIEQSYKEMLKAFLDIDKKNDNKLCYIEEGLNILKILEV
jgi:predicted dehydrogenase